jgi:hypothetical protein
MKLWIWRNFKFQLPDDWEMLQFSRNMDQGRCTFADRYQYRLEMSWRRTPGPPDFERMLSDYSSKLEEEGVEKLHSVRSEQWQGIEGRMAGRVTSRYGRFFGRESCLVELVFIWPQCKDAGLEGKVLASVREQPLHDNRLLRWKAFGMDMLVSPQLVLQTCSVQPACVEMSFGNGMAEKAEHFSRRGMVCEWLKQPLGQWLRGTVPDGVDVAVASAMERAGHGIQLVVGEKKAAGVRRIAGGRIRYDAWAWICPHDGRLYSAVRTSPVNGSREDGGRLPGTLSCCGETAF